MKIAVNAVNLRSAGGQSVGLNFLKIVQEQYSQHQFFFFVPPNAGYENYLGNHIEFRVVPSHFDSPFKRLSLEKKWLIPQLEQIGVDAVFSMGNLALRTKFPQALLLQWAWVAYPNDPVWKCFSWSEWINLRLQAYLIGKRLTCADLIFPQTTVMESRIKTLFPKLKRTLVVPNATTKLNEINQADNPILLSTDKKHSRLLCLSQYYPHKNFEVLFEVAQGFKAQKLPFQIVTTIAATQHPKAKLLLDKIAAEPALADYFLNIGPVPQQQVQSLWQQVDGLLLPTLLESFSGTYVDALTFRKPIFTSDRDFARVVCEDAAFYFDPFSADDILKTIATAFENPALIEQKTAAGFARSQSFPNWNQVAAMYISELEKLAVAQ